MKNSIIIFSLLLMIGSLGTSYAQDAVKETPVLTAQQQQAVDAVIAMDPKLSAEEIEQLKIAVLGAPTNAEELVDPKLEEQPEIVLAPVNAEPIEERELVLAPQANPTTVKAIQSGTQADGGKQENVVNLNSLSIPGAVQLEAPKVETVTTNTKEKSTTQGSNPQAVSESNKPDDN